MATQAGTLKYTVHEGKIVTGHMSRAKEGETPRLVDIRNTWFEFEGTLGDMLVRFYPQFRGWWERPALGTLCQGYVS